MLREWDGEKKQIARDIAMGSFCSQHSAIFLPGAKCRCVNLALDKGVIHPYQNLYLVENNANTARIIKPQLHHLNDYKFHIGELDTLKLNSKVDFAYLDCIGSMDEKLYKWVKSELIPHLVHPFRISFCFNYAWRPSVPFLDERCEEFDESKTLLRTSYMYYCNGDYRLATYVCIFMELFGDSVHFVPVEEKPYFQYRDNHNPMLLFTLESNCPINRVSERLKPMATVTKNNRNLVALVSNITGRACGTKKALPSHDLDTLIGEYPLALADSDKMRGWKRAKTLLCRNKANASGGKPERFNAAIKMRLTKLGFDTSPLV